MPRSRLLYIFFEFIVKRTAGHCTPFKTDGMINAGYSGSRWIATPTATVKKIA
ncbi:MAG: hypothetical protein QNK29_05735 [Desulfobacterales bacterium]|nr:hypothetical protein [Desulfobacterales bacterium]